MSATSRTLGATRLLLLPGLGYLILIFTGPLVWSLLCSFGLDNGLTSFTLSHYAQVFDRPSLRDALAISFYYGIAPVIVTLFISICLAMALRDHFPGRAIFNGLYKIPMAVPGVIAALLAMTLLDRGGMLQRLAWTMGLNMPKLIRDPLGFGVIVTLVWKQIPFMTLVIGAAFSAIPKELKEASRTLGAGRFQTFWHVELPLAMPGITAAVLLTFIGSMGAFAIPDLIGAPSPRPLSVHLVSEFGAGNIQLACAMGMLLSLFAMAVLLAYYTLTARANLRLTNSAPETS